MSPCRIPFAVVLVAVAAAAFTPCAAAASQRNSIDDMIIAALENLRSHMAEGWPEQGIPPLDPLDIGHVTFNVSINNTRLEGSLTEVKANGLSTFNIDLVHSSYLLFKADIGLGIPVLDIGGNYNVTGHADVLPIYGAGPFWMDAHNLTLSIKVKLGLTEGGYFGVTVLELDMGCYSTDIHFEGIMGGGDMGDFVNGVLSSLGPDILQSLEDKYMPWLEEAIRHEINQIIHGGLARDVA